MPYPEFVAVAAIRNPSVPGYSLEYGRCSNVIDARIPGSNATACQPTLLELHRQDPVDVREKIERRAHRARNEAIRAFIFRFFR